MRSAMFCWAALLLCTFGARSQPPEATDKLVRNLGDLTYEVRAAAAENLRKMGKSALVALEAGLSSEDAEIRRACTELLDVIRLDRGPRIEAFLNGTESGPEPFPGWAVFKQCAGNDRLARLAYHSLFESNPAFLAQLEKNPKQVAAQTTELCTKIWNRQGPILAGQARSEQILIALIAAAVEPKLDANAFNPFTTMLYQQDVRQLVIAHPIARRLVTHVLTARAGADPNNLIQTAYLASNLNLTEYTQSTLVPAVLKMVDALGDKLDDANRMSQIVQLVQISRLTANLRPKLTPLVRKLAETAAKSVADGTAFNNPNALYQASNACQALGLQDLADEILKPAVRKMILAVADKPDETNRFYQAINLARVMRLENELNEALQPSVCRLIAEAAARPDDDNRFNTALNLARMLNLSEAIAAGLRPAGRQRILKSLEQPPDIGRLSQAIYQARNLELTDLLEDTLKPLFNREAAGLGDRPDFSKLQQMFYLSQNFGANNLIQDTLKPAFVKLIQAQEKLPIAGTDVQQQLNLAKQMGCVAEALPLARRASRAKEVNGYGRGQAILTVIEFGTKEDLTALEPLLTDATNVGTMGINSTTLTAQVRDVVLGGLIFKSGKSLADHGFPYFKAIPQLRPFDTAPSGLGFANDTERKAAFDKWEQQKVKAP